MATLYAAVAATGAGNVVKLTRARNWRKVDFMVAKRNNNTQPHSRDSRAIFYCDHVRVILGMHEHVCGVLVPF